VRLSEPVRGTRPVNSASSPMVRPAVSELVSGIGLLTRGLRLIARRPRMFLLGAIPPAITSVIFTGLLIALATQIEPLAEWLTPFADGWARGAAKTIRALVGGAVFAAAVLVMVISFTTLTLALGSPLYDKLSESVEREFGEVPELDENVARGMLRALRQAVTLIAVSVVGALLLFATGFLPVIGQTVAPVLTAIFGGWMLGIELVGAPFERRGLLKLSDRRAAMRVRRVRVLGFAVPTFLLLAIPFAGVVVFPVATAGGTILARQLLGEPT
jgi:CysZ protein